MFVHIDESNVKPLSNIQKGQRFGLKGDTFLYFDMIIDVCRFM